MSADQAVKLASQLILPTITFLRLINKRKEKAQAYHPIGKTISKVVKIWLT